MAQIRDLAAGNLVPRPCLRAPLRAAPRAGRRAEAEIKSLVETGPDTEKNGNVRWRRIGLVRITKDRFGVVVDEDTMGRVLHELGGSSSDPALRD